MFYHVRITQKSNRTYDEVKLDLSEKRLFSQFIEPYEQGDPIIINGKTILLNDLERIKIAKTDEDSSKILPVVREEREKSNVIVIGGPSDEWYVVSKGEDVTDELIKGPPGYKKPEKESENNDNRQSSSVFIVHGHDHELRNDVEIFLKEIGLEPIVLHRQPDEGLTIVEKLEKYADVGYAFILLTPDDISFPVGDLQKPEKERILEYRARQNVIFEFGYFVGKLGRNRVCCIYKEGTTLPSDIFGLLYKKVTTSIEEVGWSLIKELKAANYRLRL